MIFGANMCRNFLLLLAVFFVFSGCLAKPLSEGANVTVRTGCDYDNPFCSANESCINNSCVLKAGCDYSNPPCEGANESCINNTCVAPTLPEGCSYSNPPCSEDYQCVGNECVEKLVCGKFGCQTGENDCCQDCGCGTGYTCDPSGSCLFNGARIDVMNVSIQPMSPVLLYVVPSKTIEKDIGPLASVVLKNSGTQKAYNVKLKYEVPGFTGATIVDLDPISPGNVAVFNLTPKFDSRAFSTNATSARLRVVLEYRSITQIYNDTFVYDVPLSPGRFDWRIPEAVTAWVDPTDRGVIDLATDATDNAQIRLDEERERAARQIFGHLQARSIRFNGSADKCYSDSLAFPATILKDRKGDCAGLSVLMAASLEAAGVRSALIVTPNIVLSGFVWGNGSFVPIDMREIGSGNFSSAKAAGAEEYDNSIDSATIIYPSEQWGVGVIKINPGIDVPSSKITTSATNCYIVSDRFVANYRFKNTGFDTGRRCLKATLYDQSREFFSNRGCADIPPGEERNVTFTETGLPEDRALTTKCWVD